MGCVIKYKGQSIPEEQFLQYLNKQIAILNPENAVRLGSTDDLKRFNEYLSDNPETLKKSVNLFDTEPVRLRYVLNK